MTNARKQNSRLRLVNDVATNIKQPPQLHNTEPVTLYNTDA